MTPAVPAGASGPVDDWRGRAVPAESIAALAARALAVDGVAPLSGHVIDAIRKAPVDPDDVGTAGATAGGLSMLPVTLPADGVPITAGPITAGPITAGPITAGPITLADHRWADHRWADHPAGRRGGGAHRSR